MLTSTRTCRKFSIKEIEKATNRFDHDKILGQGGEAKVYLGEIDNKTLVAVKQLKDDAKEFEREVTILSKIQHPNIVSLIGYCDDSGHKILIYEFMANGSLSDCLKMKSHISLSWLQRINICLDVARGLEHLHTKTKDYPQGIIHRDVKPGNILVGENCVGKLADFGILKLSDAGQDESPMTTNLKCTPGYCAPEYSKYGRVTTEIDVYSFGVVLFQVLCWKMPWYRDGESYNFDDNENLRVWAQNNIDARIKWEISPYSFEEFPDIIGGSLQNNRTKRPSMNYVVKALEKCVERDEAFMCPVGNLLEELEKQIIPEIRTAVEFKSILEQILDTLQLIKRMIRDQASDSPRNNVMYVNLLRKGIELIVICSTRQDINQYFYTEELKKFNGELMRIFQVNIQAQQTLSLMQISATVKHGRDVYLPKYIFGLDSPLNELKAMFLKDHTEGPMFTPINSLLSSMGLPKVVVLSAMRGCGKTTLAKMLCNDEAIRDIYKHIFFVPVSKRGDIKVIVQRLYQHKNYEVPQIVDNDNANFELRILFKKLGTTPILLILDDVWSPGLESLVGEFMFKGISHCNILVTIRFEPPAAFKPITYKLNLLEFKDAKDLFSHSAKLPKPGTEPSNVSESLVDKIVEACKGVSLTLNIVGLSLRGQPNSTWQKMLNNWSTGQSNVLDASSDLLSRLTTILDALDENTTLAIAKECFLDLGSFPGDQRIPAAALLDMWVELYHFDEDGISTLANLSRLADRSFLRFEPKRKDESGLGDFCNDEFITLHDILRELAIQRCNQDPIQQRKRLIVEIYENELSDEWSDNIQQSCLDAQLVSISTDDSFTSNWYNMDLPMVKVLILNFQSKDYSLPEFLKFMDHLKVLIITNYGFAAAKVNDLSLIQHASGLRRIRLEHISISSLVSSTLKLRNLKKISLIMCPIGEALNDCDQMFPNVTDIEIDCCPDLVKFPSALCNLVCLKKLSITSCNELIELPSEIGKLRNLKVLRLNSCTKLEVLPESIGNLQGLNFLDISDCLKITKMPTQIGELVGLKTLHIRGLRGLIYEELLSSVEKLRGLILIGDEPTMGGRTQLGEITNPNIPQLTLDLLKVLLECQEFENKPKQLDDTEEIYLEPSPSKQPIIDDVVLNLQKVLEFKKSENQPKQPEGSLRGRCLQFSLEEINAWTNQFYNGNIIGEGALAKVYYAEICIGSNKTPVAVKHLGSNSEDLKRGFEREIHFSKIQHPNIVSLIGYCNEYGHQILVYEYMAKGCLNHYLEKGSRIAFSWLERLNVCLGVARALQHLHSETDEFPKGIIHRDVNPRNILVGENWVGKLSDSGLLKLSNASQNKSTIFTGLAGYYAPEYAMSGRVTRKIDVFGFGVVLFQVLCRKMVWDREDDSYLYFDEDEDLGIWAQENVDAQIQGEISGESLALFTDIIGRSLQRNPNKRPSMNDVVLNIQQVIEFQKYENHAKYLKDKDAE